MFEQQINETFRENTAIDWHCSGGDTTVLNASDPASYALWLLTIAKQPVVIPTTMRLRPLYMYMQDPAKAMYMKGIIEEMVKEEAGRLMEEELRAHDTLGDSVADAADADPLPPAATLRTASLQSS